MKYFKWIGLWVISFAVISLVTLPGCNKKEQKDEATTSGECEITLYDGDNFEDDHITLEGPAEYSDLTHLPGSDKNWDDEADSFIASENAVAIFWLKPDFQGDSIVFKAGAEERSVEEPRSLKIRCE